MSKMRPEHNVFSFELQFQCSSVCVSIYHRFDLKLGFKFEFSGFSLKGEITLRSP